MPGQPKMARNVVPWLLGAVLATLGNYVAAVYGGDFARLYLVLFVGGCIAAGLVVRRLPGRRSLGPLFLRGFILAWAAELVLLILVVGIIAKNIGS